jgi:tetratricopeptide (TPR) repeat protein
VVPVEAEQQIKLWLQLAHEAYGDGQMVRALHYFHRALNYAQEKGQEREVALICRDLGYVYSREESLDKALAYSEQGLAIPEMDLSIRTGLMANKSGVLARLGAYRAALELLEESARLIRSAYRDFSRAPGQMVRSHAAIVKMAEDLRKVVDLLDMGVKADRIQVDFKRQEPPWRSGKQ